MRHTFNVPYIRYFWPPSQTPKISKLKTPFFIVDEHVDNDPTICANSNKNFNL